MKNNPLFLALALSGLVGVTGCDKSEPATTNTTTTDTTVRTTDTTTRPDNTAINKTDRDTGAKTPMDQGENSADIKITADIRRAVMDDKNLSTNAHNSKIITANGVVTLRGVVDTSAEKDSIETKAKAVAGVTSVDNQITVKNP